ncbi:MAG: FecR domain-containing protein, partial [Deltaproteobacteria bacterium]|nr:FecR domain-containing protein [Deltaproteobacteria bacterium]
MIWTLIAISCISIASAAPAGLIKSISGYPKVTIDTNGKSRLAKKGADVFENDRITTTLDQTAVLQLEEKTEVVIGPSSQLVLERFANGRPHRTTLDLIYGLMRTWVRKKLEDDESFVVKTPSANMGVRGTKFVTDVTRVRTTVHTLEG